MNQNQFAVITRGGPLSVAGGICFIITLMFFFLLLFSILAQDQLHFVIIVHRHGDRSPIWQPPAVSNQNFEDEWPLGTGQLTPRGMTQLFDLGQSLRKRYVGPTAKNSNFLDEVFNHNQISVLSSPKPRTIQSAQSFLYGLYPLGTGQNGTNGIHLPGNFQPIPLISEAEPVHITNPHFAWKPEECPKSANLVQEIESGPEWKQFITDHKSFYSLLSQSVGLEYETLLSDPELLIKAHEAIICSYNHDFMTRDFPLIVNISEFYNQIIESLDFFFYLKYKNVNVNRVTSSYLLRDISKLIELSKNDTNDLVFVEYSGHDSTIASLLSGLGCVVALPPYAAHVIFEIWKKEEENDFYVLFSYQGNVIDLPFCSGNSDHRCPLSTFLQYTNGISNHNLINHLCGETPKNYILNSVAITLYLSILMTGVSLLFIILYVSERYKRQRSYTVNSNYRSLDNEFL